jgi:hypothetical protein
VGEETPCVKPTAAAGVCTISSCSNGTRQDWIACPYRGLDPGVLETVTRRAFGLAGPAALVLQPVTNLAKESCRSQVRSALAGQDARVFVYLQSRLGGEIGVPATPRSPELAFDCTVVELLPGPTMGRYAFMEIQTMDFHGSYRQAVEALRSALNLHHDGFHRQIGLNPEWLARGIEGPNLANVFKRTFYQVVLKFRVAQQDGCAGCTLVLPRSVWDSWGKHLGKPDLGVNPHDAWLPEPPAGGTAAPASRIVVFEHRHAPDVTPDELSVSASIAATPQALAYNALEVAPGCALRDGWAHAQITQGILRRIGEVWPAFLGGHPSRP